MERKWVEESYEHFSGEVLRQLIPIIYEDETSRENLKPMNMVVVSPRVFWNIVKFHGNGEVSSALFSARERQSFAQDR